MGKRHLWIGILALAISAGGLIWFVSTSGQSGLSYQGKPIEYWLNGYVYLGGPYDPTYSDADTAVRAIGSKAVPLYLGMLEKPSWQWEMKLFGWTRNQHFFHVPYSRANKDFKAYNALSTLGPAASNGVPELVAIFGRNHSAFIQTAVPAILSQIGPPAEKAVPMLITAAAHTNDIVRADALYALGKIHAQPDLVVPLLIKQLDDTNLFIKAYAITALREFGPKARDAVPKLTEIWKSPAGPVIMPGANGRIFTNSVGPMKGSVWGTFPFRAGSAPPDCKKACREALMAIDPKIALKLGIPFRDPDPFQR